MHPSTLLHIHLPTHPPSHTSIYPSTHPLIHTSIQLSTHPPIHCPSIHSCIYPSFLQTCISHPLCPHTVLGDVVVSNTDPALLEPISKR